ncbi:hypothetical protein H5410_043626 [Solanum commersonii]|uniref:Zinc finger PMZ-type domain-containing protein n=1 Tax=Solanum commersonii TaxID=4109 RepID=A0A9J5Y0S2_SOLCO|nr:hypothetical protein H5410_043626 [Solanum commersonii]
MQILTDNAEHAAICEVKFNGDNGYEIQHSPYKHVVNLKKKVCSCRLWQLKGIPCAYAITAMHYKDLDYKKETYLKAYSKFIQPMTNMKMWTKSTRPSIEPPEITLMPGRPRKKRSKDSDKPSESGGATTSAATTGVTGRATGGATGESGGATISTTSTGITVGGSGDATTKRPATTSAASTGIITGGSGGATTNRSATTSATSGGATTSAITTGGRAANISVNFASVAQPTSQFSTQQSTISASGSKKKKPRTTGFGVLFGANGSVIERFGTTDRVLHCAPLKSSVPTNIDLGYKPNGLRWKGGAAVTQRQLQEQSYKRATQSTPSTQDT